MKYKIFFLAIICSIFSTKSANAQFGLPKELSVDFMMDLYWVNDLNYNNKEPYLRSYASVGKLAKEFRFQEYLLTAKYTTETYWVSLALQNGDGPQLFTSPDASFISYIDKAFFGFKISEKWDIDMGYMYSPVGAESSKPSKNMISTVSMGGYFQPGNMLAVKPKYKPSDKLWISPYIYNSYTYMEHQEGALSNVGVENIGLEVFYEIKPDWIFEYNTFFTDIFNREHGDNIQHLFYNNFYTIFKKDKWEAIASFNISGQSNTVNFDSTEYKYALSHSGFLQGKYHFTPNFALGGMIGYFVDHDGALSGIQANSEYGINTYELLLSAEYKPVSVVKLRFELGYMKDTHEQLIFNNGTKYERVTAMVTAGIRLN